MSNLIKNGIKRCGGRPKGARNKNPYFPSGVISLRQAIVAGGG